MNEELWMEYTEGDEVRFRGELGVVKSIDEENQMYVIDINGNEYKVTEDELD